MRTEAKWTLLHIHELERDPSFLIQFSLDDDSTKTYEKAFDPSLLQDNMSRFRNNQISAAELSKYITSLVPREIQDKLQALSRDRLYLGIKTMHDTNVKHPYPFHAIPWEAAFANGKDGGTWAVAYSAVRIIDGVTIDPPRDPQNIGLFCCEYNPPLARREALREVLENAAGHPLNEVREITGRTASGDFLQLQRQTMFYASCHGEQLEDEAGKQSIGLVKPGNGTGEDRYFLKIQSEGDRLLCARQFAVPQPAVFFLDACFSANDYHIPEYMISRGCNVFVGNAFAAVQDSRKNGTPAMRELVSQILPESRGKRKGIATCVSRGRRGAKSANVYNTLIFVNSRLTPDKDAFGFEGEIELPRWFMLSLLAVVSMLVSIVIGKALIFRLLLPHASFLITLLCNIGFGGILFLLGLPTVPKGI